MTKTKSAKSRTQKPTSSSNSPTTIDGTICIAMPCMVSLFYSSYQPIADFVECIRRIVLERLSALPMWTVCLPPGAQEGDKHVPILCSSNLRQAKRIVVVFGGSTQDLGIWAYRSIGKLSINGGSMVDFAKTVLQTDNNKLSEGDKDTALVIANTGQLYYHWGSGTAVSHRTWFALPQQSAVHPPLRWTQRNSVPQNANCQEHVKCVFEGILAARGELVHEEAKIDVIAVSDGAQHATRYLAANCNSPSLFFL